MAEPKQEARLLLISNRLPITVKPTQDDDYETTVSSGGLVSGLAGLARTTEFEWYGWPGFEVPEEKADLLRSRLYSEHTAIPVMLEEQLANKHYNGFSSVLHFELSSLLRSAVSPVVLGNLTYFLDEILWPLFHYHPGEVTFDEDAWNAYSEVNRIFAKTIVKRVEDGDIIWVHDYHLMLLPAMLREEIGKSKKNVKIGFFLHTPFPSSEIYRILPVRRQLLEGILHSDLIGFHTFDYSRHFLSSCSKLLDVHTVPNGVVFRGKTVKVGAYPIGIDPKKFSEALEQQSVQERITGLKKKFSGMKVIVGVDRLDYIKGVPQKLHAMEVFLSEHPEWVGHVVLVQVAVPSRGDVEEYQNLRSVVEGLVGRINGTFSTVEYTPVHFLHKSVNFDELVALYAVADVCLVSSTRDGMNLVSFEYVASQENRHGALVLSEFAGAAQSLNGSLLVNPWNIEDLGSKIHEAVTMGPEQRAANFQMLKKYVNTFTSAWWGKTFVKDLIAIPQNVEQQAIGLTNAVPEDEWEWDAEDGFDGSADPADMRGRSLSVTPATGND
ncbi:MAG: Trehalose-6-P synthase/phosphatase complex synthase subunit [Alyxoria varia]|nr:MAG: Trehalose-6-P synthase/phosphatase complex synthase subunit [Alyxoria varia]